MGKLVEQNELLFRGTDAELALKRAKRKPLLAAFDIYKTNVYYGILTETEEEHEQVLAWYRAICNLDETAWSNPPARIARYRESV